MRYARFLEGVAAHLEFRFPVEAGRTDLCMQIDTVQVPATCPGHQMFQDCPPDSPAAPFSKHCHATQSPVWHQAAGRDGTTIIEQGECMATACVQSIPFKLSGDILFNHEHGMADVPDC